jgi:hypothetical protein
VREGGVHKLAADTIESESKEDRHWRKKCERVAALAVGNKLELDDCTFVPWIMQHCKDCQGLPPAPAPTFMPTEGTSSAEKECKDQMQTFCPEYAKKYANNKMFKRTSDDIVQFQHGTFSDFCSEKTPQIRAQSGIVPKIGRTSNHSLDWVRTRKLALAAMHQQLLLDPYRQPDGFVAPNWNQVVTETRQCSLCKVEEQPVRDWPTSFGVLHGGTYSLIDDFYIESTEGLTRVMGAPQSVQRLDVSDLFGKQLLHRHQKDWDKSGSVPKYMSVVHTGAKYLLYVPGEPTRL